MASTTSMDEFKKRAIHELLDIIDSRWSAPHPPEKPLIGEVISTPDWVTQLNRCDTIIDWASHIDCEHSSTKVSDMINWCKDRTPWDNFTILKVIEWVKTYEKRYRRMQYESGCLGK